MALQRERLAFAFSSTFWSQVVIAEVYGLSTLAAVGVMGLGLGAAQRVGDQRWLVLTAYAAGLGVTTHLNHLLILPGLVAVLAWQWYSLKGRDAGGGPVVWLVSKLVIAAAFGYSLILYLPVRNGRGPGFHWGDLDSPRLVWEHINGALYRSSFFSLPLFSFFFSLSFSSPFLLFFSPPSFSSLLPATPPPPPLAPPPPPLSLPLRLPPPIPTCFHGSFLLNLCSLPPHGQTKM